MEEEGDLKYYELGYLVMPSVPEEKLPEESGRIISYIDELGGRMVSASSLLTKELAYSISKEIDRRREIFKTAYFGSIRFELSPEKVSLLKQKLEVLPSVLRFLLIRSSKFVQPPARERRTIYKKAVPETPAASKEELEKEIDALIAATV